MLSQNVEGGVCTHGSFLCVVNAFFFFLKSQNWSFDHIKYPTKMLTVAFKNIAENQLIDARY